MKANGLLRSLKQLFSFFRNTILISKILIVRLLCSFVLPFMYVCIKKGDRSCLKIYIYKNAII